MAIGDVSLVFTLPTSVLPSIFLIDSPGGQVADDVTGQFASAGPGQDPGGVTGMAGEDQPGTLPTGTTGTVT